MAIVITSLALRNTLNKANHLTFDATDSVGGASVVAAQLGVFVKYPTRDEEIVAYRGKFISPFLKTSRIEPITNGYKFHLLPFGGWPDTAKIIFATGASSIIILGEVEDWGWIGDAVTSSEDYGSIVDAVTQSENYGSIVDPIG